MSPWRALLRWVGALVGVGLVVVLLWLLLRTKLTGDDAALGPTERRINVVVDIGDDDAPDCSNLGLRRGDPAPSRPLRRESTACVIVGVTDKAGHLRWFFVGRGVGDGTVHVPKPTRSGVREVLLENGAVVPIGPSIAVRCSADPNERFESWIAAGAATSAYLDAAGFLVAIDCDPAA
jgi:hypothetical protein